MTEIDIQHQLTDKFVVDIEGNLLGNVEDVEVEVKGEEIAFHLRIVKRKPNVLNRKIMGPETLVTVTPEEILCVGKDCIILSYGELPPLSQIESFKDLMKENENLSEKLKELEELREKNQRLSTKLKEFERLKKNLEEEKLKNARLSGENKVLKEMMKKIDDLKEYIKDYFEKYKY